MYKKYFFGKLKPLSSIMKTDEYINLAYIDYDSESEFLRQRFDFLKFYKERFGEWILFVKDTNNYVYIHDIDEIIIVSINWITDIHEIEHQTKEEGK